MKAREEDRLLMEAETAIRMLLPCGGTEGNSHPIALGQRWLADLNRYYSSLPDTAPVDPINTK